MPRLNRRQSVQPVNTVFTHKPPLRWFIVSGVVATLVIIWIAPQLGQSFETIRRQPIIERVLGAVEVPAPVPLSDDGFFVATADGRLLPLKAVVIDNHKDAGAPLGLEQAPVVLEYLAEGPITRLLALVDSGHDIAQLGPIRSLRPYSLDFAESFGATIYHVGGSPDALNQARQYRYGDVNQFYRDEYFWRSTDRPAPHNVFTNSQKLNALPVEPRSHVSVDWQWVNDPLIASADQKMLLIGYPRGYEVRWRYDPSTGNFLRLEGGASGNADPAQALSAKSVLVVVMKSQIIDAIGRRSMQTTGKGSLMVFAHGAMDLGSWTRQRSGPFSWRTSDDRPLKLVPGKLWIEVVPPGTTVTFE